MPSESSGEDALLFSSYLIVIAGNPWLLCVFCLVAASLQLCFSFLAVVLLGVSVSALPIFSSEKTAAIEFIVHSNIG